MKCKSCGAPLATSPCAFCGAETEGARLPPAAEVALARAREATQQDRHADAIGQLFIVLEHDPESLDALSLLAHSYTMLGMLDRAADQMRAAVACFPEHPVPRFNLGTLLHRLGDVPGARAQLLEAQRLTRVNARLMPNPEQFRGFVEAALGKLPSS